jgi:hypothetical protein
MTAIWVSDEDLRQRLANRLVITGSPPAPSAGPRPPSARFRRTGQLLTGDRVWDLTLLVIAQARTDARAGDSGARAWLAYVRGETDRVPPVPDPDWDQHADRAAA